ncbi:hypothetical protein H6F86_00530 [Phormidium sp. FACHB-592]|uniref:Uncharacterized protein n=1 Tax=Stenomitos frigidus AS-A4 TaxID=2933935 RepID=A0ABV0KT09_9CYAN|nr:hypothetical protein [Phormidium sp. FACHB-592]MBD2072420.1 hypothetical protein [Phormidium sp. FACHB-592]
MRSLQQLEEERTALEATAAEIRAKDYVHYPALFVLDTATVKGKLYHRKRTKLADGKPGKAEYISPQHYAELAVALENGRSLHKVEKQISNLVSRIDRIKGGS